MDVWLIHLGEQLPVDGMTRPFRYSLLAGQLLKRGHSVTRWTSTFNHITKSQRFDKQTSVELAPGYRVEFLYARGYRRNVSLARLAFHRFVASRLVSLMERREPPDLILSSIPVPLLCKAAVSFGRSRGIPVVIDIRDKWPDVYLTAVPNRMRPIAKWALIPGYARNRRFLGAAAAIMAVSPSFLSWALAQAGREAAEFDGVYPLAYPEPALLPAVSEAEITELRTAGVDPSKVVCCFIGQFERSYDLETVIRVAQLFERAGPSNVQFVFAGSGSDEPHLRRMAQSLSNVLFLGWLNFPSLRALLRLSSVGLASYRAGASQSIPNKPVEYLSEGLALVSSLSGDLEHLIETHKCGFSYRPSASGELATIISRLAGDPALLASTRERSRRLFSMSFAASKVYEEMVSRLETVVRDHRRKS